MKQARDNQVVASGPEFHTSDVKTPQRASRNLDQYDGESEILVNETEELPDTQAAYNAVMAFMEEPVTIRIQKSSEKYAPNVVQCWVNGKGAEQFVNGKWMQCGWLPINHNVITRRKYVEVLARARQESIATRVVEHKDSEENHADRFTSTKYPFSVIQDTPAGHEWLSQVLQGN